MEFTKDLLIFEKDMRIINRKYNQRLDEKSDNELILLYKKDNNPEIVGELYKRYAHIVFGVCLKYLKNPDMASDSQLEIYSHLYDSLKKYEIKEFKSWLLTVARNHCISFLKKQAKEIVYNDGDKNSANHFMESEGESSHTKEKQLVALEKAILQLKPEQKQCVELFFLENKTYFEIVDITKHDLKKVKSYIQNGKRNLQIMMESHLNNED